MTLETFFEKLDPYADARNAVAKLRELALEPARRSWHGGVERLERSEPLDRPELLFSWYS